MPAMELTRGRLWMMIALGGFIFTSKISAMELTANRLWWMIALGGFTFTSKISEAKEVWTFTMTVSVRPGTNRLSGFPLEKAREQGVKVVRASWFKWQPWDGRESPWSWLAGVKDPDNRAEIGRANGTHARYIVYGRNATLEIRNITEDDNNDRYMISVWGKRGYRESLIYKLSFFEPEESNTGPGVTMTCTGWKIGFAVVVVLLSFLFIWVVLRKFCPSCAPDQPIQGQVDPNQTAVYVVNSAPNGNVNFGKNYNCKETLGEVDDVPMLEP